MEILIDLDLLHHHKLTFDKFFEPSKQFNYIYRIPKPKPLENSNIIFFMA